MPRSLLSPLRAAYEASPPLVGAEELRTLLNNISSPSLLPWYRTFSSRQLLGVLMTLLGIFALGYMLLSTSFYKMYQYDNWIKPAPPDKVAQRHSESGQMSSDQIVEQQGEDRIQESMKMDFSLETLATSRNVSTEASIQGHDIPEGADLKDVNEDSRQIRNLPQPHGIPRFESRLGYDLREALLPQHRSSLNAPQPVEMESLERVYYLELGMSLGGKYDIPRLQGQGTLPLQLSPGQSLSTSYVSIPSHSFASPSVELGTAVHRQSIWVYAGMEFHPSISEETHIPSNLGVGNDGATIREAAIRGYSIYAGTLFEQRIFGFLGLYGRAAVGFFDFEQTVIVYERLGTIQTNTQHLASSRGIGGSLGAGLYFNLWGVRIRTGLRSLYVGGNGSVSSSDLRLGIEYVM